MKLECPELGIYQLATEELIETVISRIKPIENAFVILGKNDMEYLQALSTQNGFVIQFQLGALDKHYEFNILVSRPKAIEIFQAYMQGNNQWSSVYPYSKVNVYGFWGKAGYLLGKLLGAIIKLLGIKVKA